VYRQEGPGSNDPPPRGAGSVLSRSKAGYSMPARRFRPPARLARALRPAVWEHPTGVVGCGFPWWSC